MYISASTAEGDEGAEGEIVHTSTEESPESVAEVGAGWVRGFCALPPEGVESLARVSSGSFLSWASIGGVVGERPSRGSSGTLRGATDCETMPLPSAEPARSPFHRKHRHR